MRGTLCLASLLLVNACADAASSGDKVFGEEGPEPAGTPVSVVPARSEAGSRWVLTEPVLDDAAWPATWRRLSIPSVAFYRVHIESSPSGWLAVSSHDQGVGKVAPTMESVVYRSRDGTHWTRVSLPGSVPLARASLAYGGGHYVIAGERDGNVVLNSVDGETWREQVLDDPLLGNPGRVTYVRDRFFAMGFSLWSSVDGENWTRLAHPYNFSPIMDIAFGGSQYIGVGLGTLLSPDGVDWQLAPIAGDTKNRVSVLSAEGSFYVDDLTSADGHTWKSLPPPYPSSYAAGHLMTFGSVLPCSQATGCNNQLGAWFAGDDAPRPIRSQLRKDMLPAGVSEQDARRWSVPVQEDYPDDFSPPGQSVSDSFDFSRSDGLDCISSRCLLVPAGDYSRLYLVP